MRKISIALCLGLLVLIPASASASHHAKRHHARTAKHKKGRLGKKHARHAELMTPSWAVA
jgi:hypothetical protein